MSATSAPPIPYRIPNPTMLAFARALPRLEGETRDETEARIAAELQTLDALAPRDPVEASFALQFVLSAANTLAQFARANAPGQTPDGMRRALMLAASLQRGGERALSMLLRLRKAEQAAAPPKPEDAAAPRGRADDAEQPLPPRDLAAAARTPPAAAPEPAAPEPAAPEPAAPEPPEPCWLWQRGQRRNIHEMSDEELREALHDLRDAAEAPRAGA
jgi:hypothetical protein